MDSQKKSKVGLCAWMKIKSCFIISKVCFYVKNLFLAIPSANCPKTSPKGGL